MLWTTVRVVECNKRGDDCSNGYRGDRCEGCIRDGFRLAIEDGVLMYDDKYEDFDLIERLYAILPKYDGATQTYITADVEWWMVVTALQEAINEITRLRKKEARANRWWRRSRARDAT